MGQTADLRKGIVQLPLHALHLLLKAQFFAQKLLGTVLSVLPFRFQAGHSLLVGSELLGDGQQFFKDGLSLFAARSGDMDKILQNGSEIAAGIEQAAAHGKKYQQHQHGGDLRHAFQHDAVIGAFRDQHRQGMGRLVPVSHRKRLRNADKGKLRPLEGGQSAAQAPVFQQLIRHKAEAACGIGQQAL